MPAPSVILDLVERFHRNKDVYKQNDYKEAEVRAEFIDVKSTPPIGRSMRWSMSCMD